MRIGIISDIHADIVSLQKALDQLRSIDVEQIICVGDLVEGATGGNDVVNLLRAESIPSVQGNHDENAIRHSELDVNLQLADETEIPLSQQTIDYLNSLPAICTFEFDCSEILMTHAMPSSNAGAIFQDSMHDRFSKSFKKDLSRSEEPIMLVGHTHFPFDISFRGKRVINPGALCKLKDRDSHTLGVFDTNDESFSVFGVSTSEPVEIYTTDFV